MTSPQLPTLAEAIASVDRSLTNGYGVNAAAALVLRDHARDGLDPVPDALPTEDAADTLENLLERGERLTAGEEAAVRSLLARARAAARS